MNTVRIARDLGSVEQLFPDGVSRVVDLPYTIFDAIHRALIFLSFEEYERQEQPPKRIWMDATKLNEWFEKVRVDREKRYSGKSSPIEDPVKNDAASSLIVGDDG